MKSVRYFQKIRKRGPFGIPYTWVMVREAHMDEASWRRLRKRPFSIRELLMGELA